MTNLGTIDLEILDLAARHGGRIDEKMLEASDLKRLGVGRLLDALASLRERRLLVLDGSSFSMTGLARETLWSDAVPLWAKILRLLYIKPCSMQEMCRILDASEASLETEAQRLQKNHHVLFLPQRQDGVLTKMYEILPGGVDAIKNMPAGGPKGAGPGDGIHDILDAIRQEISDLDAAKKESLEKKLQNLQDYLERNLT